MGHVCEINLYYEKSTLQFQMKTQTLPFGFTHANTTPISPINALFSSLYDKCSIIQAFPPLCLSAPLCVIVCSSARLAVGELWCCGCSLSAFSCSEGNQLWQSCKLFLGGQKGGRGPLPLHSNIPSSGPSQFLWMLYLSGLRGPSRAISMTWTTIRDCLVSSESRSGGRGRWTEEELY